VRRLAARGAATGWPARRNEGAGGAEAGGTRSSVDVEQRAARKPVVRGAARGRPARAREGWQGEGAVTAGGWWRPPPVCCSEERGGW
jgi:hypothetical protein